MGVSLPAVLLCAAVSVCTIFCGSAMEDDLPWWRTAVLYQVYPRSFQDSNGDGVGDIKGITNKAEYFKEIGVTVIWISPIFKSPMADFGYDIADYRVVDPIFGSNEDLFELIEKLKTLGIRILLDLVPNHTSDEHEWFQKSAQKIEPYTDYYMWHDGELDTPTGEHRPPNNWMSVFGGGAWKWHEGRQQFYLHQFVEKQPDLNYRNPLVVKEMDDILRFWLDKGVDGFRVDAVPFIFEDKELRDNPPVQGTSGKTYYEQQHIYTENQPETYQTLQHWAELIYNYSKADGIERAMFVEAYADLEETIRYYGHGNLSLMQPFNFELLTNGNQSTDPQQLKQLIDSWMTAMTEENPANTANWVIGNHDQSRVTTKYGTEMVDALNLLTGVLPGIKVTYNGEEIGMVDTFIKWNQTVDPSGLLRGPDHYQEGSRDPERTPMQWDKSTSAGFSSNKVTWLPVNPNYWWLNVAAQREAPHSHLKVFHAMTEVRKDPVLQRGTLNVLVPDEDTLLVIRQYNGATYALIINMGSYEKEYTSDNLFSSQGLEADMTVEIASTNSGLEKGLAISKESASFSLRPKGAVLLKSQTSEPTPVVPVFIV